MDLVLDFDWILIWLVNWTNLRIEGILKNKLLLVEGQD